MAALRYRGTSGFIDDVIFAHSRPQAWRYNTGTADDAVGRLGLSRTWLKQQAVSPLCYDVGCCKPGAKSAFCDCIIFL